MGDAGLNVADAFRSILISAEPLLEWMSKGTVKFSEWLKTSSQAGRETGSLGHFFDETREAMERVWRILKPLGEGLLNVGHAAKPLGNEILDSLGKAAEGWAKWTGSIEGQNKLRNYFVEVKPAIFAIGRLVRDLTDDFFELGRQKGVATVIETIRKVLLPVLTNGAGAATGFVSNFLSKFNDLHREGLPIFDAFIITLAEHAGEAGLKIAGALARGFLHAGILGKLVIGGWLIKKLGGVSAIVKAGTVIGGLLGDGIGAGAGAGGIAGGIGRKGASTAAKDVGQFGEKQALRDVGLVGGGAVGGGAAEGLGSRALGALPGLLGTGSGLAATAATSVAGAIVLGPGGLASPNKLSESLRAEVDLFQKLEGLNFSKSKAQLESLQDHFATTIKKLRSDAILGMDAINQALGTGLELANETWLHGTPQWRTHVSDAMHAAIKEIKEGMEAGTVDTKEGQKEISRLLEEIHIVKGNDPFGLAKATAKTFKDANGITSSGVAEWIRKLERMPKGAREKALDANTNILKAWADGHPKIEHQIAALTQYEERRFGTSNKRIADQFGDLNTSIGSALKTIIENTRRALDSLGVKGALKQFTIKHPNFVYGTSASPNLAERQRGGPVPAFATGGLASVVPGNSTGDRHVLALNGVPIAKVESREGIFVGNRKMMAAAKQANDALPRFQGGGLLRKGGMAEPKLEGNAGPLKQLGQQAIHKVFEGAKDYLDKHHPQSGALMTGSGPVESVFARVAKRLSRSKVATLALGEAGFAESGMRDLGYGDSTSEGSLQLLASTAASMGIDPHDEGAVASAFLLRGYTGKGGANALAAQGLPAQLVAQGVQGSAFADGSNYLAQEGAAKGWMKRFGLQSGGLLKGLARGGSIGAAIRRLAAGGMVDPSWDPGSETIAGSIAQLVGEYAKRYDADITAGFDPGGGHVSPGHNETGTATDVVPRDGNWDGAFAKGLEELASLGFEVGYDGSIPGTQSWPGHGRGNHAHIEWVGNGTAGDARLRLREFLGGVDGSPTAGAAATPKEDIPAKYRGALTQPINFPPAPKHLEGVAKEITRWQGEISTYRSAKGYAEKHGKPGVAQAIARNLAAIEQHLSALRQLRSRVRLQNAKKALSKRLKGARTKFDAYDQIIEGNELGYNAAAQFAEQVVALEPQSPELPASATDAQREAAEKSYVANFKDYVEGQERPAYSRVLEKVADWRNSILRAETFGFGKGRPSLAAMETRWEGEDRGIGGQIEHIKDFAKKVAERLSEFKHKHPGVKALPDWLQKQVRERDLLHDQLPILQLKNTELRKAISEARERFFPGGDNRLGPDKSGIPKIPLPGSGSLEEALRTVQGIHWPELHELLPASALAPPRLAGRFGGVIWDVETSIEELGLKVSQALNGIGPGGSSGGSEGEGSERSSLLEQLLREANQRNALDEAQGHALEGWDQMREGLAAHLPKFHTGGQILGPANREVPIMAKVGETMLTERETAAVEAMAAMGAAGDSSSPHVNIESIVVHGDGRATVRYEGREFEAAVERVTRKTRGTGVLTPGGARR